MGAIVYEGKEILLVVHGDDQWMGKVFDGVNLEPKIEGGVNDTICHLVPGSIPIVVHWLVVMRKGAGIVIFYQNQACL